MPDDVFVNEPETEVSERGNSKLPSSHWLHLANGKVVEAQGTMTHYKGIPVVRAEPIPVEPVADSHEF